MGIQDVMDSAVNGVKTPVTNAWKSLGSAAFTKINNAVRQGGGIGVSDHDNEKLMKENPNPEAVVPIMGVLGSAMGGLKAPVSNALKSSYGLGWAAVYKIDNVLREANGVEKLKDYLPGPEVQEKIGHVLTHPATKELLKLSLPPGAVGVYNVAGTLLKNQRNTDAHDDEKMCADLEHINKDLEHNITTAVRFKSSSTVDQKPEEVIDVFMMKGLKVRDFMDNQVVPPIRGRMENEGLEK